MITVIQQKNIADEVFNKTFLISPFMILAGGAPRDWYFGNVATDLDFYFYRPDLSTRWIIEETFKLCGFKINFVGSSKNIRFDLYESNPAILRVAETEYKKTKIQFIQMNEKVYGSVVDKFPLNISMIYYQDGEIHPTRHFNRAVKHKAITKMNPTYKDGDGYIKKVLSKFPDYDYYSSYEQMTDSVLDRK